MNGWLYPVILLVAIWAAGMWFDIEDLCLLAVAMTVPLVIVYLVFAQ